MKEQGIFLSEQVIERPILCLNSAVQPNEIAKQLIINVEDSYNNSVEPFVVLGCSVLSPFRDIFKELIDGFPIIYLFGSSHAGKTNLLNSISKFYGLGKSYVQSGAVTINRIWALVAQYSRMPVILDELLTNPYQKNYFSTLIKSCYDCKPRGRMKSGTEESIQYVNSTLIFSSNFLPPEEEAVINRILLCEFDPKKFNAKKASVFNETRDKYLSKILIEVLKMPNEQIIKMFNDSKKEVSQWIQEN